MTGPHGPHDAHDGNDANDWSNFLREVDQVDRHAGQLGFARLTEALSAVAPDPQVRARLLTSASSPDRFARFADHVARLLDLSLDKAKAVLARIDDPSEWTLELPGISFFWVEGGPAVAGAIRGFVRVQAGLDFPEHEHLGEEHVLILQGAYQDSVTGKLWSPGEESVMQPGSQHAFKVLADGPDLLKLAVVDKGLDVGGRIYAPR